MYSFL